MTTEKPRQELVSMEDVSLIRTREGNEVRMMKSRARLSVDDGTLVKLPMSENLGTRNSPDWRNVFIPSAKGFGKLAADCGIICQPADTVVANGTEQPNGYQDPETGVIYYRVKAGGFTKMGIPCISDRTVSFDVKLYNLQDLIAKADKFPAIVKILPKQLEGPGEMWARYDLDEATNLWVDCSAKEFVKWQKEMVNRRKNAARICQTFAERNAIAHHPALPPRRKFYEPQTVETTYCWYSRDGGMRWDGSTLDIERQLAEGGGSGEVIVEQGADELHAEDEHAVIAADISANPVEEADASEPEDDLPFGGGKPEETKETNELEELIKELGKLKRKKTAYAKACKAVGVGVDEPIELLPMPKLVEMIDLMKKA